MKIKTLLLVSVLVAPLAAFAQLKTETFDTQTSASADGWIDYLDQANGENYGWSNSNHAGGTPGEAGGLLVRTGGIRSWYADETIGGLSLNDYFSVSGQISITRPSTDAPYIIGYFNTNDPAGNLDLLGLSLAEGTGSQAGIGTRFQTFIGLAGPTATTFSSTGSQQPPPGETNFFSVTYDPNAGTNSEGRITLIYTSAGTNWTTYADLTASARVTGASFNAFGILVRAAGSTDLTTPLGVYLDNVTYSVWTSNILEQANGTSMVVGETDRYISVSIPDGATVNGPVTVNLVSTNPAVAYPSGASGGTLTVTFPQNSPFDVTNVPITAITQGSTLFYLTNAASGISISPTQGSNVIDVVAGTVSLTPSTLSLGYGENDKAVTVSIVNGLNSTGPVTVSIDNSDSGVAVPQTSTVTFPQGGFTSTNIIVNALTEGTTTLSLDNLTGGGDATLVGSTVVTVGGNPITISPNAIVTLIGQTSQVLTVNIPPYANASGNVTVDLESLNPSVVVPQGAVGNTLALTFPAGGTNSLSVPLNVEAYGTATLVLTNNASALGTTYITNGTVAVTVPVPQGTNIFNETFDTQASASADGWTDYLDQTNGDDYGWSDTGNANGTPGEAGGNLVRLSNRSYYADITVGPLNLNDYVSASGVLFIAPPSTDAAFDIGYFNTNDPAGSQDVLALGLADGTSPSSRISVAVGLQNGSFLETFGTAQLIAAVPVTWSLNYDPTAGPTGNGQLTVNYTLSGAAYSTNINLTAAERVNGATFNAFGIFDRGLTTDTSSPMGIFVDNLTYTKGYSLAPSSAPLGLQSTGTSLTFTWTNAAFSLAYSTNVAGPYVKIPGASSPFVTNLNNGTGFFRLVWP
jgi:hypothetical protein